MAEKNSAQAELKGNTLKVYLYVLKKGRVGVREVQRSLGFSNPSLAQYHLNKLKDLGLLGDENGEYFILSEVKVDVMRYFLRLGTLIVPRFVFYAVFFTTLTLFLGATTLQDNAEFPVLIWFMALLIIACSIFWYEAIKAWRSAPSI
jgi:hypothetical protein